MGMVCARASLPGWVLILALGAFLAPAGIATTVLLVALVLACIPAVITAGVWKRTLPGDLPFDVAPGTPSASRGVKASGYHYRDTTAITDRVPAAIECDTAAITDGVQEVIDAEFTVEDAMPTSQLRGSRRRS